MDLQLFDIDYNLKEDPNTRDLKELYNIDAVNQSIDIWLTVPYRIGKGLSNGLLAQVFINISQKTTIDIQRDIEDEFKRNYQVLNILQVLVTPEPVNLRYKIKVYWQIPNTSVSGVYNRFWYNR
jgi:hypothetical protein